MQLCLDCRNLLEDGERCAPGHVAAALDDPRLTPGGQPRPENVGRALGSGVRVSALGLVVTLGVCAMFSMCSDHPIDALTSGGFWIFAGLIAIIVVPALIFEQMQEHRVSRHLLWAWLFPRSPRPRGVRPAAAPDSAGAPGRADGDASLTAPLSGRPCLAWAASIERDGEVFVRAGRAASFRVALDNGGVVAVPAGRIELHARRRDQHDPRKWTALGRRFPGTGWEVLIARGDTVAVLNDLETALDDATEPTSYREPPETILVPRGLPILRR